MPGFTSRLARAAARSARSPATQSFDLYYASDVHGSDICWRKFLGAGRFYDVNALVMGGDLTGKAIVPIERVNDGSFRATLLGETRSGSSDKTLDELVEAIRFNGMYPWVASRNEISRHAASSEARDSLFEEIMLKELTRWVALADERMAARGIDVFVIPGNDDPWTVDAVLKQGSHVQFCDDKLVQVGPHEMISSSYANRTPWSSPRELDEDELYTRLKRLADQLERPHQAIFNLHVPPYDSGLDTAIEIDPRDLTHVYHSGVPHEIPVGSTAVRQIIEEYQPVLTLHGHIHESRGDGHIGRTIVINSGSEYNSGRIHGVVVRLADADVISHQFVVG
jgi:Icc-related predicted phosphoesterase